jgi:hypothetical protein
MNVFANTDAATYTMKPELYGTKVKMSYYHMQKTQNHQKKA